MRKTKLSAAIRTELASAVEKVHADLSGANAVIVGAMKESLKSGEPLDFQFSIKDGVTTLSCNGVKHKFRS